MKLHYSQTKATLSVPVSVFYYLMKLHYSQTNEQVKLSSIEFYYLMKLHYSQTRVGYGASASGFTTL